MFEQKEDLVITDPLKNVGSNFQDKLPVVISIGLDETVKTFNHIQLSRLQCWENLLIKINPKNQKNHSEKLSLMFPLMESKNLDGKYKNTLEQARQNVNLALNHDYQFSLSDLKDRITQSVFNQDWNEVDWAKFWIKEFSRVLGYNQENCQLTKLHEYLQQKNLKVIFLMDGLENIFLDLAYDTCQQTALKALIDNLPNKLTEIKQSNLGLIVFLHRDSLRKTIKQNSGQFESLYSEYRF